MNPVMTLTEYLSQTAPAYMPIVRLAENEYTILDKYTFRKDTPDQEERAIVQIHRYPQYTYMQRGSDKRLYAVKPDGSYKDYSCFWIK